MKIAGVALVVLGVLALVCGGISYNRQRTVLDVGPFQAAATEQKHIPLSPIVGGMLLCVFTAVARGTGPPSRLGFS
jgi:hypothetical protein